MTRKLSPLFSYIFVFMPAVAFIAPRGMSVWLILAALLCAIIYRRELWASAKTYKAGMLSITAAAFIALCGLSTFWSESPSAIYRFIDLAYVALTATIFGEALLLKPVTERKIYYEALTIALAMAIPLFVLYAALDFPIYREATGYGNYFQILSSNVVKRSVVMFSLLLWPVCMFLWQRQQRTLSLLFLILSTASLLLFTSRSAMLGMAGGISVLLLSLIWHRIGQLAGFMFMVGGLIIALPIALTLNNPPASLYNRLDDSNKYRLEIWHFAATQTLKKPILGWGIDDGRVMSDDGQRSKINMETGDLMPLHPHNIYLHIWMELGGLGAFIAGLFGFALWRRICSLPRTLQPWLWGYVTTASIMLAVAFGIFQAWWLAGHFATALLMIGLISERRKS